MYFYFLPLEASIVSGECDATVKLEVEEERQGGAQCLKVAGRRNQSCLLCGSISACH